MDYIENLDEIARDIKCADAETIAAICGIPHARKTQGGKPTYVCPDCGNGTGKDGDGIAPKFHIDALKWHCFKCGKNFSNVDLLSRAYGIGTSGDEFPQLCERAAHDLRITINYRDNTTPRTYLVRKDLPPPPKVPALAPPPYEETRKDRTSFYNSCANQLPDFIREQGGTWRGLTLETLQKFNIGYHDKFSFGNIWRNGIPVAVQAAVVLIPFNRYSFMTRLVGKREDLPEDCQEIVYPKKFNEGRKYFFNFDACHALENKFVFVVEGAIDAMSGYQVIGKNIFVALNGSSLPHWAENDFRAITPAKKFIVMLDNDDAGKMQAQKVADTLIACGHLAITDFLPEGSHKDLNEYLQTDAGGLRETLLRIIDNAPAKFDELKQKLDAKITADEESNTSTPLEIERLRKKLAAVTQKLADFDADKSKSIETIKNLETFDVETIFQPDILRAAGFAKLYDSGTFAELKNSIQNFNSAHKKIKFPLRDFGTRIKSHADEISNQYYNLRAEKSRLCAEINTLDFTNRSNITVTFPAGYVVDAGGIRRIIGDKEQMICPRALTLRKIILDDNVRKIVLAVHANGIWRDLPPLPYSTLTNARNLPTLSDYGLLISSARASAAADFFADALALNEEFLPHVRLVTQSGWHEFGGRDYFVDPRRKTVVTDDNGQAFAVELAISKVLTSRGSLKEWSAAYDLIRAYPIARFVVAAAVAAPLLKIIGERNFIVYLRANTHSGKSTALNLAGSAVGNSDFVTNFSGTSNGILSAAVSRNCLSYLIDERQAAGEKLRNEFATLIYRLAEGQEKLRSTKEGNLRDRRRWSTIVVACGEESLLPENVTGGAYTRTLNLNVEGEIIPADVCKQIWRTTKDNFGLVFPRFLDEIDTQRDMIVQWYQKITQHLKVKFSGFLGEHVRYVSAVAVADIVMNLVLGIEENAAVADAMEKAIQIFDYVPLESEFDDSARAENFVIDFIARNSTNFIGHDLFNSKTSRFLGKIGNDFVYITVDAVRELCKNYGLDYNKTTDDLTKSGFFVPADSVAKGRRKPSKTVHTVQIGVGYPRVFRIPKTKIDFATTENDF